MADRLTLTLPMGGRTLEEWRALAGVGDGCPACHPLYPWLYAASVEPEGESVVVTFAPREAPPAAWKEWRP
jgi:hypothetical protein